jgi:hypothetical protein
MAKIDQRTWIGKRFKSWQTSGFFGLLILALMAWTPSVSRGDFVYFQWNPTGSGVGTGSAEEYSATFQVQPAITLQDYVSNLPAYVARYGSQLPGFEVDSDSASSGTFVFSAPLRPGSIMVILDVDRGETMSFSANRPLALIENVERLIGGSSDMPTWNSGGQSLTAASGNLSDSAASIIDISGVTQLSFSFSAVGNTGSSISFGVTAIPEPRIAILALFALTIAIVHRIR